MQEAGKELERVQREAADQGLALGELRLKYRASRKTMASQQSAAAAMSYRQRYSTVFGWMRQNCHL